MTAGSTPERAVPPVGFGCNTARRTAAGKGKAGQQCPIITRRSPVCLLGNIAKEHIKAAASQ